MTVREAVARGTKELEGSAALREDAARDAALLLMHVVGIARAAMIAGPERVLTAEQARAYEGVIARRLSNEPIQYIAGEQEFFGLALRVTPAVLIPRPETEHLVEAVLAEIDARALVRVLDVGTGSGAIAIALASRLPRAEIVAVDISRAALDVAAENAARHGVSARVRLVESDLLGALAAEQLAFDAVVSNPPYVAEGEHEAMHPQVREWEPAEALFAGADGMDLYRRLVPQAWGALRKGGLLAMEIGQGQREAMAGLLAGWEGVRFVEDLRGISRVVVARKR
jgi:release factor glutamine methyltransferase